ncbi:MAG: hypothetical protein Q8R00_03730 [Candidatus Nanoarchaeia archaeon]|nr:hypothetical protein [Candidatus Nanoarchaeia archaeon]
MAEIPEPPKRIQQAAASSEMANAMQGSEEMPEFSPQSFEETPLDMPQRKQSSDLQPYSLEDLSAEAETSEEQPSFMPANIPQEAQEGLPRETEEFIQEIVESVISEKWEKVSEEIGDLSAWQDRVNTDLQSIKQEILRVESRLDNLQTAIVGRIGEYDSHIKSVGTEVKAIEDVLSKIMQPLSTNIKELSRLTEDLKKEKTSKKK